MRIFGAVWHKKSTREAGKLKRSSSYFVAFESKMKEFDTHFVKSLLEGVKAKVRFIGDNGVYALFKLFFSNKK